MLVTKSQAQEFLDAVDGANRIAICSHLNPDGDAIGSTIGLTLALQKYGKKVEMYNQHEIPYNLKFLPGIDQISQIPPIGEIDLAIVLDLNNFDRLGIHREAFESAKKIIVIDHHVKQESPGDLKIVHTESPATALLIAELLIQLDWEFDAAIAENLLAGIVTDTGSFRYRNTTPEALNIAAKLLDAGADIVKICTEVYTNKPIASVKLLQKCLSKMQLISNDRIAISVLSNEDFAEAGATEVHTEGLTNELLAIETVQIAAVIRQPLERSTRVSIRSREAYDVAAVAAIFGGGGHRNAAGCTLEGDAEKAVHVLVPHLISCLEL